MNPDFKKTLVCELIEDEGIKHYPYKDSIGNLTIGCGRNLEAKPLSADEIDLMLNNDIDDAVHEVIKLIPNFSKLSDNRKRALINMCFNLGQGGLSKFKKMIIAIQTENFVAAVDEMRDSKWMSQIQSSRFDRLCKQILEG